MLAYAAIRGGVGGPYTDRLSGLEEWRERAGKWALVYDADAVEEEVDRILYDSLREYPDGFFLAADEAAIFMHPAVLHEELLGDKKPTGVSWQAYKFFAGPGDLDKPIFLPPRTPDKITLIVREAYLKLAKDPDFKKATTNFFGKGWAVRGAKETEALVLETTSPTSEVKEFLRKLRKKHGLPTG